SRSSIGLFMIARQSLMRSQTRHERGCIARRTACAPSPSMMTYASATFEIRPTTWVPGRELCEATLQPHRSCLHRELSDEVNERIGGRELTCSDRRHNTRRLLGENRLQPNERSTPLEARGCLRHLCSHAHVAITMRGIDLLQVVVVCSLKGAQQAE